MQDIIRQHTVLRHTVAEAWGLPGLIWVGLSGVRMCEVKAPEIREQSTRSLAIAQTLPGGSQSGGQGSMWRGSAAVQRDTPTCICCLCSRAIWPIMQEAETFNQNSKCNACPNPHEPNRPQPSQTSNVVLRSPTVLFEAGHG